MACEAPEDAINANRVQSVEESPPIVSRIQQAIEACSKGFSSSRLQSIETGDFRQSDAAVFSFSEIMDSIDGVDEAFGALSFIHGFLSDPSSNQMVIDVISLELPKAVAKLGGLSGECREVAESVINRLVSMCSPRDMVTAICDREQLNDPNYQFYAIQRHHVKQAKVGIPVILKVISVISSEVDDENKDGVRELLDGAVKVVGSIQEALVTSSGLDNKTSNCVSFVIPLSHVLHYCGLSYLGLITGCSIDAMTGTICQGLEEDDEFLNSFPCIKVGASLAVIWGYISPEVVKAAMEDMENLKYNLQKSRTKRWQALGVLRYLLSSIDQPWKFKHHCIEFLSSNMYGSICPESAVDHVDFSSFMPSLFSALQAVQRCIIYAPDGEQRKKAFSALKQVLLDVPTHERFDILKALVTNSNSPSMVALLIDIVKEQLLMDYQKSSQRMEKIKLLESNGNSNPSFWSPNTLEFLELILKPPKGGPPSLPEQSEVVIAALNLYRFILITELTGNTNYTGILSKEILRKAYSEWFLPLKMLVSGIQAENENDISDLSITTVCSLNPVQFVLHRCIELVEENL
ncbi:Aberrant root formation protein 4 [Acorus gramineus]|uniref:Aberrant root formation protein 4 n=1 Tax=Acorus gramineus TaxID=55184 RepID=A0AAV9BJY0_ACOGR|nr:Aberrant root formation protein 4 [Acorus gramineus]